MLKSVLHTTNLDTKPYSLIEMVQFAEKIPLNTTTDTTPSTTTSLERVEIDIIRKNTGYYSKSKGICKTIKRKELFDRFFNLKAIFTLFSKYIF